MNSLWSARKTLLVVVLGFVFSLGLIAWWQLGSHRERDAAASPRPMLEQKGATLVVPEQSPLRQALRVAAVADSQVEVPFALPAVVEADPAKYFKALPPLVGRVTRLGKNVGDQVAIGDVLYALDSADLAQALSDADKARAQVALTKAAFDRQTALGSGEIASQRDIEQAESDHVQARSEQLRAETRLVQLGLGAGRANAANGHSLVVRSPQAGFVVDESATAGAYWNDLTAPLMTIADLSVVFVSASADEHDVAQIFVGQSVEITLDAFPGETFAARVRSVGPLLDADTRRLKVRVPFANPDGRVKPGMFGKAMFKGKAHRGVLVPIDAVVQSGFDSRVFVEVSPWAFEPRVVELGPRIGRDIEILKGLAPGSRVVVKNGVLLNS